MTDKIYKLHCKSAKARRGEVATPHGIFNTPAFMPVGTTAAVKALTSRDLDEIGAEIHLGNTYHLYLRPGSDVIRDMGGLAKFNGWNKPTLTDSGGFQVFSLSDLNKITEDGVEFQSHIDGSRHFFTAERVMEIQHEIGADIIMAFDQCVPYPSDHQKAAEGVRRTFNWAKRSLEKHEELNKLQEDKKKCHRPPPKNNLANSNNDDYEDTTSSPMEEKTGPRLFGIVQGSTYKDLRTLSAEQIVSLDFPGNAIGGLSVGESKGEMEDMLAHTIQYLPADKPRYLMGVGYPEDILMAVSYGVDMFDCVLPTRNARTGCVFTSEGPIVYRNANYTRDEGPLDPDCDCMVCQRYSRAYLRHLYNQSEITGMVLATYHSAYFFQSLMRKIRKSIEDDCFAEFRKDFLAKYFRK